MSTYSNRSRASSIKRKPRLLGVHTKWVRPLAPIGDASIALRHTLKAGDGKVRSRIPKAWQDTHRVKPVDPLSMSQLYGYASDYMDKALAVRAPFNPNRISKNVQTLRAWDPAKRKFVAKRIQIGSPGSVYQAPVHSTVMRGNPCLFDDCTKDSDPIIEGPEAYRCSVRVFDEVAGKYKHKDVILHSARNVQFHKPCGVLPPFQLATIVKRSRIEADLAVQAWREAKQLAHALALIELGGR